MRSRAQKRLNNLTRKMKIYWGKIYKQWYFGPYTVRIHFIDHSTEGSQTLKALPALKIAS